MTRYEWSASGWARSYPLHAEYHAMAPIPVHSAAAPKGDGNQYAIQWNSFAKFCSQGCQQFALTSDTPSQRWQARYVEVVWRQFSKNRRGMLGMDQHD